jgi:hypothetical protein
MQADFSVELGPDDPTLEFPWTAAESGGPCYYDLKAHPERLALISEASANPPLAEFLTAINSRSAIFHTAKCDAWQSLDLNPDEDVFEATVKFVSYIDLVYASDQLRYSFEQHENLVQRLTQLLHAAPEIPAAAELIVRRCFYHLDSGAVRDGLYITLYVSGFGDDDGQARQRWTIALKLVENALLQCSAESASAR